MRTRDRIVARFYKSSDRTHITRIRWTKEERAQWEQDQRDTFARMISHLDRGDVKSALAALTHIVSLQAVSIFTVESINARNEFLRRVRIP